METRDAGECQSPVSRSADSVYVGGLLTMKVSCKLGHRVGSVEERAAESVTVVPEAWAAKY